MSKKEEVMKQIQEKITMSDEKFNQIYADMEKAFKDRGVKPSEEMVLNRILSYLTPTLRSSATKMYGIFLGVEDNYGFNKINDTVKFDAIKQYQENPESTIANGVVTIIKKDDKEQVIPMWHYVDGVNVQDWKLSKPIIDNDYSATATILLEQEKDKKYVLNKMNLRGSRRKEVFNKIKELQGKRVSFMAIDKGDKLNDSTYTTFTIEKEQLKDTFPTLVKKYLKNECLNLANIIDFYNKNADIARKGIIDKPVFIKVTTQEAMVNENSENLIIPVTDSNYHKNFTVFVSKVLGTPSANTETVFAGRIRKTEGKNENDVPFTMSAFMYYQEEKMKNVAIPDSLKEFSFKEIEGNVEKSLEAMESKDTSESDW